MNTMATEVFPHHHNIDKQKRNQQKQHNSFVIWFTGLSGSGKSTLANMLEQQLYSMGIHSYVLDGDNVRTGLNKDLDFSEAGRIENIRRISEVTKLFVDAGIVAITAFISPYAKDRELAKSLVGDASFIEVYLDCPLSVCEERDVKELYKKARAGTIKNFTGIDAPYEAPTNADLTIRTGSMTPDECIEAILKLVQPKLQQP